MIRERLVKPYLNINLEYYDLSMEYRDQTDDKVIDYINIIGHL